MVSIINTIKRDTNKWSILLLAIVLFISIPILTIAFGIFEGPGETWEHIVSNLLPNYITNTFYLILGTSLLTLLFGVSAAWIVSRYTVPYGKVIEWLLIVPLAIPSYITAYAYAGIFDYGSFITTFLGYKVDVMNSWGLVFVLSISLYPYIYVASRAFFTSQSNNLMEASKLLGAGEVKTFFTIILPIARPAFVGGLLLVLMEVLNDYGAAKYYGVTTFTTGIFRSWFSLEEPETAIYLSAILVGIILVLITIEKWQRKRIGYANSSKNHTKLKKLSLPNKSKYFLFMAVLLPILVGFVFPVLQLLYWTYLTFQSVFTTDFLSIAMETFFIASIAAFFTVVLALGLLFFAQWNRLSYFDMLSKVGTLGYAIPGAVIAVGVLIPTLFFDKWLINVFDFVFHEKIGFFMNGTIIALLYAYTIRFAAVAYNPIEASALKLGTSLVEASKMLGSGNLKTFYKIQFPLLKPAIISSFILVFVDVMKELPLTLILKPYSVNTLAVKAYEYASDELIAEAALPSLCIILTGILPILFLNRLISKN
ncbi:iron ABC transporter permease [Tenacibaculum sp. SG-28]|uniref:ABC transporter permease n=1 Tax=Tenacibaculum sp. SG-28 TaxID=754426 RepID=UPI000CF4F136|nr:iron ABC transporter permease [Tenacibaculum sp. SG-28]PQJ23388.1 ABC transporter permease [Tenacibaculum sp. SG-28]